MAHRLGAAAPAPARLLAADIAKRAKECAILVYGSGVSVEARAAPADIMYDFYAIVPAYDAAIASRLSRLAARLLPPNVYYHETASPWGALRAKVAILSIGHFERLVSARTFHSYFWARFAQPSILLAPEGALRARTIAAVAAACETFVNHSAGLAKDRDSWRDIWTAGLAASYKAELRAEPEGRAERLLEAYGDWPRTIAERAQSRRRKTSRARAVVAWRLRALVGALLSVLRLLKATATFKGGIDYIAWKVARHTGIEIAVTDWERRHPFLGAPGAALRYYRLRSRGRRAPRDRAAA